MCAVSHFGIVFGILCAVTCIMPAGHKKTTQIKCEIERRHNLKLACSRDAVWHMRVATYCKKFTLFPQQEDHVFSCAGCWRHRQLS